MFERIKKIFEDALSSPECFVVEAAEERWQETQPCPYEGAFWDGCEDCSASEECRYIGKACVGEGKK
jgi:hypothetical protein